MSADVTLGVAGESGYGEGQAGVPPRPVQRSRQVVEFLRDYAIVIVVVLLAVVLSLSSGVFLTKTNLLNLLEQAAPIGILACALTLVLIVGEFDLSAGAIGIITGIFAAKLQPHVGTAPSFLIGILGAVAFGLINGALVSYGKINSFICTLATSLIIAGLGLVITKGFLVTVADPGFSNLGFGTFLGVRYSIWIFLAAALICGFVLSRTKYGRWICAVGGNMEAARLSGINTRAVKVAAFAASGFAAGVSGAILASRTSQGAAGDGTQTVLAAFAAVVVGGTSVNGGRGSVWRTVLGVLFLGMITNGFDLLAVDPVYQTVVQGLIVLVAVGADAMSRRHAR